MFIIKFLIIINVGEVIVVMSEIEFIIGLKNVVIINKMVIVIFVRFVCLFVVISDEDLM